MTGQGQLSFGDVSDVPRPKPIPRGEAGKRDAALDLIKKHRKELIVEGRKVAHRIASSRGRVSSTDVFKAMEANGWGPRMAAYDRRWMGPVFFSKDWEQIGTENTGSHKRPVAVWRIRG